MSTPTTIDKAPVLRAADERVRVARERLNTIRDKQERCIKELKDQVERADTELRIALHEMGEVSRELAALAPPPAPDV